MAKPVTPLTHEAMLTLAARGVGRVDRDGARGATLVTVEEIEAMACVLALCGLRPIQPDAFIPASFTTFTEGERA